MGHARRVMGNFLKVCLPSGVSEALIMVDWRRGCEGEGEMEGGEAAGGGRRFHSGGFFLSSDMISAHKGKRRRRRRSVLAPPMTDGGQQNKRKSERSIFAQLRLLGEAVPVGPGYRRPLVVNPAVRKP